ncbi:hypothetical protein [Halobaculum sp. MBLA0143]|uniref:hypothetical protein n=1 Tax=Halobaculum sp. MBLA0143 TaxID=3079933 RepID=UPI003523E555
MDDAVETGFWRLLRTGSRPVDLVGLVAVPVVLVAVYALPTGVKRGLVFDYTHPTLLSAYTAHFVHFDPTHLLVNLGSYLLLAPTAYALAVFAGEQARFRVVFVVLVTALPVTLSALNLAVVRPRIGYGFSGLSMGLLAVTGLLVVEYTAQTLSAGWCSRADAPLVFFVEATLIALAVRPHTTATLAVAAGAAVVAAGYAVAVGRRARAADSLLHPTARRPGFAELAVVACVALAGFPAVAFPANPTGDGTVLNLYTHLLGFAVTFVAAYSLPEIDA